MLHCSVGRQKIRPPRLSRRRFSSARDDQPSCCPNSAKFIRLTMSLSPGTGAAWRRARLPTRRSSLGRSSRVSVLTIADEKGLKEHDAERLAASLRNRSLVAEGYAIDAEDCPIGVTIQEHAIKRGAQLLVMGGFGHSRVTTSCLAARPRTCSTTFEFRSFWPTSPYDCWA